MSQTSISSCFRVFDGEGPIERLENLFRYFVLDENWMNEQSELFPVFSFKPVRLTSRYIMLPLWMSSLVSLTVVWFAGPEHCGMNIAIEHHRSGRNWSNHKTLRIIGWFSSGTSDVQHFITNILRKFSKLWGKIFWGYILHEEVSFSPGTSVHFGATKNTTFWQLLPSHLIFAEGAVAVVTSLSSALHMYLWFQLLLSLWNLNTTGFWFCFFL